MSRKKDNTDREHRRLRTLAALVVSLGGSAALAGQPAARLLPPTAAADQCTTLVIMRASGEDVAPVEATSAQASAVSRPDDFKYPPPYSKPARGFFDIPVPWGKDEGKATSKTANSGTDQLEQMALGNGQHLYNQPIGPMKLQQQAVEMPAPPPTEIPAWRWFGYGAPVPGRNFYAPDGVYPNVHANYYHQTGATPGAIPANVTPPPLIIPQPKAKPDLPTLPAPIPTGAEPPRIMSRPFDDQPSARTEPFDTGIVPAKLELPVAAPAESTIEPVSGPLSARTPPPIIRAQAPEREPLSAVCAALQRACAGCAKQVEVTPTGDADLGICITLTSLGQPERLAQRISRLPELTGYNIVMQFVR